MYMKNIGEVIGYLRKKKSITQEELGNKVGLSRVCIVKIENSQRAVSLEEAVAIASFFELDVDTMYSYIKEERKEENDDNTFVMAFKAKGTSEKGLKEIKRIELLVDALFAQEEIRGE